MEEAKLKVSVLVAGETFVMVFPSHLPVEKAYKEIEAMVFEVKQQVVSIQYLRGSGGILMKNAALADVVSNGAEITAQVRTSNDTSNATVITMQSAPSTTITPVTGDKLDYY